VNKYLASRNLPQIEPKPAPSGEVIGGNQS
jgi:hypothetical protein